MDTKLIEEMGAELTTEGKTKRIYRLPDGNFIMEFTDAVTGKDGNFNPEANRAGLKIAGMGLQSHQLTEYFFDRIEESVIKTHRIKLEGTEKEKLPPNAMLVKKVELFGPGLACTCWKKATGSLVERYYKILEKGQSLNNLFEISLKDDVAGNPLITEDLLYQTGLFRTGVYKALRNYTERITNIISEEFAKKDAQLIHLKLEFGMRAGELILIDEISAGCMRVENENGEELSPDEIYNLIFS